MPTKHSTTSIKVSSPAEHVLLVLLSKGPVNAFDETLLAEFQQVFESINGDVSVRAVILASTLPKFFTAGLDLKYALSAHRANATDPAAPDAARRGLLFHHHILTLQAALTAIERCRVPVLAALHGNVLGLGVDIAAACDVRYAAEDAQISIKEVDIGLASDMGTLARLPKSTGNASLLSELALSARPFSAAEALTLGLVSRVVPGSRVEVVEAALQTARIIASKSPLAVAGTKRLLLHARDHSVAESLEYTAAWNAFAVQANDVNDAFTSFATKKPVAFVPLPRACGKL